jgi:hypothetical protein
MKRVFFLILFLSFLLPLFPSYLFSGRRALIVGIDNYILNDIYQGKINLVGCVNDALDMKSILIERFDFKEDEIRVLLNHNATKKAILEGFRWLIRETVPQDWVIFSFSGHGKQLPDKDGDEEDGYDECICPSDVEPKYLLNLISDDEINQFIAELKDRRAFFLFDSCHSGTIKRGRLPATKSSRNAGYFARVLPPPSILEQQSKSRGSSDRYYAESEGNINSGVDFAQGEGELIVFSAAAPNQVAIPINVKSDHPNGAMTYAVLMGLKGAADKNNDSIITYRELLQFSRDYMRILKVVQEPQIDVEPGKIDNPVFFLTPQAELSSLNNSSKTFSINLRLHDRDSNIIKLKDYVEYYVESEENGYLYLFAISPDGEVTCLFPNIYQKNNNIQAGERIVIPPRDGGFRIEAVEPLGKIKTLAIVTRKWLDLTQFCGGKEEELLHTLGSDELKELVRSTRGITKALSPAEWAAAVLELEVVKK